MSTEQHEQVPSTPEKPATITGVIRLADDDEPASATERRVAKLVQHQKLILFQLPLLTSFSAM